MDNIDLFEGENFTRKEAIKYLEIPEKSFYNYFKYSKEIPSTKLRNRWQFNKSNLDKWKNLKDYRTVTLSMDEYRKCFEFAMRMVYSGVSSHGTGIRGFRSEVQQVDDFILGILGEHGVKKFLKDKFNLPIELDMSVHIDHITPQDIVSYKKNNKSIEPKLGVTLHIGT